VLIGESGAVAFLEFFLATAGAGIVAANVFQGVAHGFLMVAVGTVYMAMVMLVVVIMVAVRAVDVGLFVHA
jgi:hypothetical protein